MGLKNALYIPKSTERAEQFWKMMGAGNISLLISSSYCKKSLKIQNWCIVTNSERCLEHFLRYLGDFLTMSLKLFRPFYVIYVERPRYVYCCHLVHKQGGKSLYGSQSYWYETKCWQSKKSSTMTNAKQDSSQFLVVLHIILWLQSKTRSFHMLFWFPHL